MKDWLGRGWDMTMRHKYVGVLIFVYRLTWGFFLYRIIDSVVTPVLARYPDIHPNKDAAALFLIEAQFRLLRTDLADPLLWLLGSLLILRMIMSPMINAGLFYSFHHVHQSLEDKSGTRILFGMRKAWKPVALLYGIENVLIALPAVWLVPMAKAQLYQSASVGHWLLQMLPYAAAWLAWGLVMHLLFLCMQFGAVSQTGIVSSVKQALVRSWPLIAVTLTLAGIGIAASALLSVVTVVWSGLLAVVLHQAFHLIRALLAIWTAASQYAAWRE